MELSLGRARKWPLLLVAPGAAVVELAQLGLAAAASTHDEDLHGRLVRGMPARVLGQPAVEEVELLVEVALHAPDRRRPVVDVERPRRIPTHADVAPRPDDQPL